MCISLIAELIWFFFTIVLLLGPGKVYRYLGGVYNYPLETKSLEKKYEDASRSVIVGSK